MVNEVVLAMFSQDRCGKKEDEEGGKELEEPG
jgi:hypothetical protein